MIKKHALIIGLQYSGSNKLNGCWNDNDTIINTINKIYGFNKDEITLIQDQGNNHKDRHGDKVGSKKNIESELQNMVNKNLDFFFFYVASHGIEINDYNNDESNYNNPEIKYLNEGSNMDTAILTSEFNDRVSFLPDDKIRNFLAKMKNNTTILSVIDCCHSGTILDLQYLNVIRKNNKRNFIEDDSHRSFSYLRSKYKDKYTVIKGAYNKESNLDIKALCISGCRDGQSVYEKYMAGSINGTFTFNLSKILLNLHKSNMLCKDNNDCYNIKDISLIVTGKINNYKQIPMITSSFPIDIENTYLISNSENNIPIFKNTSLEKYNKCSDIKFEKEPKGGFFSKLLNALSREDGFDQLKKYFKIKSNIRNNNFLLMFTYVFIFSIIYKFIL
jgi:hypothetical protein